MNLTPALIDTLNLEVQLASTASDIPDVESIRAWVLAVFSHEGATGELVIRIVDADEIHALNRQYRGMDKPTNVLSFPFEAPPEVPVNLLGDLVICAPVVAREAREQGKGLGAHWAHMVVHGTLHLLGYDHENDVDAEMMETRERDILAQLGYANPYATELER